MRIKLNSGGIFEFASMSISYSFKVGENGEEIPQRIYIDAGYFVHELVEKNNIESDYYDVGKKFCYDMSKYSVEQALNDAHNRIESAFTNGYIDLSDLHWEELYE